MIEKVTEKYNLGEGILLEISSNESGRLNNEIGPALSFSGPMGSLKLYFRDGQLDRIEGPAIEAVHGKTSIRMYFRKNARMIPAAPISKIKPRL